MDDKTDEHELYIFLKFGHNRNIDNGTSNR